MVFPASKTGRTQVGNRDQNGSKEEPVISLASSTSYVSSAFPSAASAIASGARRPPARRRRTGLGLLHPPLAAVSQALHHRACARAGTASAGAVATQVAGAR